MALHRDHESLKLVEAIGGFNICIKQRNYQHVHIFIYVCVCPFGCWNVLSSTKTLFKGEREMLKKE